ncbi:hypothetical protein [Cellulomonas xiejunii]|uniref:hypothetical protein n=1 Tax=Cellulomonas xiejunii TaxID=2968083 RepID=UPI001D0EEA4C|nr:hypothetical protein [Cellulomonas xiejunii]MCC2314591.1 hypothetical protein [Cellulomonas xiejunii]
MQPTPAGTTRAGRREVGTVVLGAVPLLVWVAVAGSHWSWALASLGVLPDDLLVLTWRRGLVPVVYGLGALVAIPLTVVAAIGIARRRGARGAACAGVGSVALVLAVAAADVVVAGPVGYGTRVAFEVHRPAYEAVVAQLDDVSVGTADGYGRYLPLPEGYGPLTVRGTVDVGEDHVFFPQWTGIPDDAGGFFHMRSGSPAGLDMRGWACADPVHLDDDWWACGMG